MQKEIVRTVTLIDARAPRDVHFCVLTHQIKYDSGYNFPWLKINRNIVWFFFSRQAILNHAPLNLIITEIFCV